MKRAYSTFVVKSADEATGIIEGIASTPSTDRMGDVVEPKGAQFTLPIPLLWQHRSGEPIGHVIAAKVTEAGIEIKAQVMRGLLPEIERAWTLIKSGLVRGLSIGFNPLESADIKGTWGQHFTKWDWLELSAVTIAANQDATIHTIKSADDRILGAASGQARGAAARGPAPLGVASVNPNAGPTAGANSLRRKGMTMKTIQQLRDERTQKAARMRELVELRTAENRHSTDDEATEFDSLAAEVKTLDDDIRQAQFDAMNAAAATPAQGKSAAQGSQSRGPMIIVKGSDADEQFKGQNFTRMIIAKALASKLYVPASTIAEGRWGKSNPTLVRLMKANEIAGGGSGSGEWGSELVSADNRYTGDFIEYLHGITVYDKVPCRVVPANVSIKGSDGAATGYWVGESKAIPTSAPSASTVALTPLKVAALAVVSNELLRDSSPAAEAWVRDMLAQASGQRVDATFLSATAASATVSPAGLLNGLVAGTSNGNDAEGVRQDIADLYAGFITAKNATGLYFVTTPSLAKALQLMRNALGQREFDGITSTGGTLEGDPLIVGDNVGAGDLILMKPSDIWKIGDSGIAVSISTEATIEQNSAPAGATDTPAGITEKFTSMFQSESTAIKVVRSINFQKRRSGAVAFVGNANYGVTAS